MGISRARAWLAVTALALGSVRGNSVAFHDTADFVSYPGSRAAFVPFVRMQELRFRWASEGITVEKVTLWIKDQSEPIGWVIDDGLGTGSDTHEIDVPTPNRPGPGRRNPQSNEEDVGSRGVPLVVQSASDGGYVYFQVSDGMLVDQLLYFKASWANGYNNSRWFSIVNNPPEIPDPRLLETSPASPEEDARVGNPQAPTAVATTAGATTATDTAGEESTNASNGNLGNELNAPQESAEPASVGLASGAIIGIAVGCGVAGLLLILGLVWYLLRRRRQKKAMHPVDSTYGTGNRGEELMAEKEASADVDVTPHSPYSDDGAPGGSGTGPNSGAAYPDSTAAGHGDGAAAAAAVAAGAMAAPNLSHLQDPPRSFTPYSDRPSVGGTAATAAGTPSLRAPSLAQNDEARVSVPSPIPGRATPRGLTTPYAHLVEEGMTEDEIRRLEDEERQLDAAIEQAGRR